MISLEEAKERLFGAITPLGVERVALHQAQNRYCAEVISSKIDLPLFDNSAMDGYAVRSEDLKTASEATPIELKLIGKIGAGEIFNGVVSAGTSLRLFTGSVLPAGADAVVMQEDVSAEKGLLRFVESVKPFENVRLSGEDIRAGTPLIETGARLSATRLALLAATGHKDVLVRKQPQVALIATGDELTEPGDALTHGKIYESNRTLLHALLAPVAIRPAIIPLVRDDLDTTISVLKDAFAEQDAVITTGGVSVGEFDFVKEAFNRIGGVIDHWKIAIRPGKPFVFGKLGSKLLFGLPGNPVSALVTFLVLVRPALLKMQGAEQCELPRVPAELTTEINNPGDRRHFVRARFEEGKVALLGRQASHMLGSIGAANCLVDVPPGTQLQRGAMVDAQLWELPES
jgi:molybdopterin molybdotransferase